MTLQKASLPAILNKARATLLIADFGVLISLNGVIYFSLSFQDKRIFKDVSNILLFNPFLVVLLMPVAVKVIWE